MSNAEQMVKRAACFVCGMALSLSAGLPISAAAAGPASQPAWTPPKVSEPIQALSGQRVLIAFELDLDGDQTPSPRETAYLTALLEQGGVKAGPVFDARVFGTPDQPIDPATAPKLVIIGIPTEPAKLTAGAAEDPLQKYRHEQAVEIFNTRTEIIQSLEERCKQAGVEVVHAAELAKRLNVKPPTPAEMKAMASHRLAPLLTRGLPELRFEDNTVKEVLDFCRDVTGLPIQDEKTPLAAAGLDPDALVSFRAEGVSNLVCVELLVANAYGDTVTVMTDGEQLILWPRANEKPDPALQTPDAFLTALGTKDASAAARVKDVAAKLDREVTDLVGKDIVLSEAVDFVRDSTQLNVDVDFQALGELDINRNTLISIDAKNVTGRTQAVAVAKAASPKLAVYVHRGEVVRVTTKERAAAAVKAYPGSTLLTE